MTAYKEITGEFVEELALTGAAQLDRSFLPPDFKKFREHISQSAGQFGHGKTSMEKVEEVHPNFREHSRAILELAGGELAPNPNVMYTSRFQGDVLNFDSRGRRILNWHQDFKGGRTGFSVLFSQARNRGINELLTAGRADRRAIKVRNFDYGKGPIVIAQLGFGANLSYVRDTGQTWHAGLRNCDAGFVAIDVL